MKTNLVLRKLSWIVLLFMGLISCDTTVNSTSEGSNNIEGLNGSSTISSIGNVFSTENSPIENVTIKKLGSVIARSDRQGNFAITGSNLNAGDVITYEHPEFVTVTKVLKTNSSLTISMKKRAAGKIIDSRVGDIIALEKGGSISIPANAFSFRGNPYNGAVKITASYIDVTNNNEVRSVPGALITFDKVRNQLVPLTSYGVIEVNAVIPKNNELLNLTKGSSIEVSLPVLNPDTPGIVNLYGLDRDSGYWVLEGELTNMQGMLLGKVTGVNEIWNAEKACGEGLIGVKVRLLTPEGFPARGCDIRAVGLTYDGTDGPYFANSDGRVEFMVCPDSVFELQACTYSVNGETPAPYYSVKIQLESSDINPGGYTNLGNWILTEAE